MVFHAVGGARLEIDKTDHVPHRPCGLHLEHGFCKAAAIVEHCQHFKEVGVYMPVKVLEPDLIEVLFNPFILGTDLPFAVEDGQLFHKGQRANRVITAHLVKVVVAAIFPVDQVRIVGALLPAVV